MLGLDSLPSGDLSDWAAHSSRVQSGKRRRASVPGSDRPRATGCSSSGSGSGSSCRQHRPGHLQLLQAVKTARRCAPEPEPQPASPSSDRQRFLLRYAQVSWRALSLAAVGRALGLTSAGLLAQEVTPELISVFEDQGFDDVSEAMRDTIGRMLGSLPEEFFDVKVSAARFEDLAQLCYSVIMTGAAVAREAAARLAQGAPLDRAGPAQGTSSGTSRRGWSCRRSWTTSQVALPPAALVRC